MTNHTSLIQRLTDATEGSRELDAAIDKYLYGFSDDWIEYEAGKWRHKVTGDLTYAVNYTTSIDAALTLVLDRWRVYSLTENAKGTWMCTLARKGAQEKVGHMFYPTPALALCIAALRARDADN